MKVKPFPARHPLTLALSALLAASFLQPVYAQDDEDKENKAESEQEAADEMEPVVVTGSLIQRLGFDTISPVQVITSDVSATTGQLDTTSILQSTNVAAGSTQISNQFSGFVVEGGNGVQTLSLRGLGANRTLVLLDGRRPGPAGTRGQVGAFDLNVMPTVILQRAEILKDGGGSIYGSDAVAGVVNLITRKSIDRTELSVDTNLPFDGGGERVNISGATGWNFDNGSVVAAFQAYRQEALKVGDRDFFECPRDLVRGPNGNLIDREDRSITAGTPLGGCNNLYANTVIAGSTRYVPSVDGSTVGPLPGYRPRRNANATATSAAFYEDVLNFDFFGDAHIFSEQQRTSFYAGGDFTFGNVAWEGQFLYNNRETSSERFRQFFPAVSGTAAGLPARVQPIMPFRSNQEIDVDYYYVASGFSGGFGDTSWAWRLDTTYSRSDGDYTVLSIARDLTGDVLLDRNGGGTPLNYFDPRFLSGSAIDELEAAVGAVHTGNTVYTQMVATGSVTGELFEMDAGTAAGAFGVEFRSVEIDDNPSDLERTGGLWGQSSATGTEGDDDISEIFGEVEIPLLAGLPGVEQLTFNTSARAFKYDTVEDSDNVWKVGLGWQVIPSVRLRATNGTSYRAPGLYELFLGDQTAFVGQLAVDPCIDWGNSSNPNIQRNCAAAGIPADYSGTGSSATIVSGGGLGVVRPETSKAFTAGIVLTPETAGFSISIDYFKIEVNDQIDQLGPAAIVGSCYALPNFPNAFCGLFDRAPATAINPYNVTEIRDSYININRQLVRGYDLNLRWDREFTFGKIDLESQFTYTMEDVEQLFDSSQESGFDTNDQNGIITRPELVGNIRTGLTRGDFTYTWGMRYVGDTENFTFTQPASYFGNANPVYDFQAGARTYHSFSVQYRTDNWDVLLGVENLFDKAPPNISTGVGSTRYGTVPAFATQYDWYGRSFFGRFNYRF